MEKMDTQYKKWRLQGQSLDLSEAGKEHKLSLYQEVHKLNGREVPVHLVEFFDRHPEEGNREGKQGWEMALRMKEEEARRVEEAEGRGLKANTGVRVRGKVIRRLEEVAGKDSVEWGITIKNRSTEDLVGDTEIINGETAGKMLLINGLTPDLC